VRRFTRGCRGEFVHPGQTLRFELFIFEKASLAECIHQMCFQLADLDLSSDPNQVRAQIQRGLLSVEASQALH